MHFAYEYTVLKVARGPMPVAPVASGKKVVGTLPRVG